MSIIKKHPLVWIAGTSGIVVLASLMLVTDMVLLGMLFPLFGDNFKIAAKTVALLLGGVFVLISGIGWNALKNKGHILVLGILAIIGIVIFGVIIKIDETVVIPLPDPLTINKIPFNCVNVLPCETMNGTIDTCVCKDDSLRLNKNILSALRFDSLGHTCIFADSQWVMIDKEGSTVLAGIAAIDNGPDYPSDNRIRFCNNLKWGYATGCGTIVIPAKYDGAMPFENGTASVCIGCKVTYEGEYMLFDGGRTFNIDTLGYVVQKKKAQ
jgi:hypothetical protein